MTTANQKKGLRANEKLKVKSTKLRKARQNAGDQVVIGFGFGFAFDWLRDWRGFLVLSQNVVSKNRAILGHFRHSIENCFKMINFQLGVMINESR